MRAAQQHSQYLMPIAERKSLNIRTDMMACVDERRQKKGDDRSPRLAHDVSG